jgi:hypothetical protein
VVRRRITSGAQVGFVSWRVLLHEAVMGIAVVHLAAKRNAAMRYTIVIWVVVSFMSSAFAEKAPSSLGVLTCTLVKPDQDAAHKMTCGFKPAGTGAEEKYNGTVSESSQDLPSGKIVLIWTVLGPAEGKIRAGILAQRYESHKRTGPDSGARGRNQGRLRFAIRDKRWGSALRDYYSNGAAAHWNLCLRAGMRWRETRRLRAP